MALATVLVLTLSPGGGPAAPLLAAVPAAPAVTTVAASAAPVVAEVAPPGGRIVRDAQLDRYLRAHRDYATALPGSLPGGSGRSITNVSLDR
jgi:sigma-E factor negative regulatory protein RseA